MEFALRSRRLFSTLMAFALIFSSAGMFAPAVQAAAPSKVVLVGDLQSELGHTGDWDPAAAATEMTDAGNGTYKFTGILPAGTYEYKVALNGNWDVSYGFGNYTNPTGASQGGNIKITLAAETSVTFYYNHNTLKIADSTYYTPLAADKLPRVVGSLQTKIGDSADWDPAGAKAIMNDDDFDSVYSITKNIVAGNYEYKIVLGTTWDDAAYPGSNAQLSLPQELPVTFKYNLKDNRVSADFTVPAPPPSDNTVPAGHLRVHYNRPAGDYDNMGLWLFNDVKTPSAGWPAGATSFQTGQTDSYGRYLDIPLADNAKKVGVVVVNRTNEAKDGGDKIITLSTPQMNEIWLKQGTDAVSPYEPVDLAPNTVRIHYTRTSDSNYGAYGLWSFDDVAAPSADWPSGAAAFTSTDRYGGYVDVLLKTGAKKIGFLVVNRTSGDKDGGDKAFTLLDRYNQLWIKQGDNTVYVSPYGEVPIGLVSAEVLSETKILLGFTMTDGLDAASLKNAITIKDKDNTAVPVSSATITGASTVEVAAAVDLNKLPLSVTYSGRTVSASTGWRMLDEMYAYTGNDLGATYNAGNVTFKLWAPKASQVAVKVYDKSDSTQLVGSANLVKGDHGVWSAVVQPSDFTGIADLKGYFYQYEVTNDGVVKTVLDPYAKSMAAFTVDTTGTVDPGEDAVGKAAIVDLAGTDPASFGYANIAGYEKREDAIIWEAHIRDFTSDPSVEGDLHARWGSFDAFKDKLGYIKSLGVTHVQLLPVMAWYYGDETQMGTRELDYSAKDNEYNWGYDPQSYFSPDGAYSLNPKDPELRIKEMKGLVDAIHEAGMGVVLDVVYTHMAKKDFLNDIVPNYYAFQDANGAFIGGFGNNLATNHKMAEKLMVDSVKYWFDEYKIDGMRWDMMGDATYDSVQKAYDAAAALNPKALFIGEGWRTFGGQLSDPALAGKGADQDWMNKTDNVGVFSDEIRNELKSGFGSEGEPRFITGGARSISTIFNNIKGQPSNVTEDDPGDIVQYIEAHDNLPLYDVIAQSIKKDPSVPANNLEIHKRVRLGNMLMLTSQGTAFFHAGQEYGRTKQWLGAGVPEQKYTEMKDANGTTFGYFIHDSYDSSDAINKFDWQKATNAALYPVNNVTREYTSGLMELRRSTNAFRLGDQALVNSNVSLINAPEIQANDRIIAYKNKSTDGTGHYYVFLNADNSSRSLTLTEDLTGATVLVDNDEAGTTAVSDKSGFTLTSNSITLDPLSAVIIKKDAAPSVVTSLELDSSAYSLQTGTTHQTAAFANLSDGGKMTVTNSAAYVSDKPAVATVTAAGVVKAVSVGTATIAVSYGGQTASVTVTVTADAVDNKRYIQFNYIRPDGNYTDWNIWLWDTGVKNDQKNFDKIENGVATAMIEIAPGTTKVGFVLRKGTDWSTAKQDFPDDRYITVTAGEKFTKVNVTSNVRELDIKPSILGPILNDGNITFLYRDDALFASGQQSAITRVKVKINGTEHAMAYDSAKEWFTYTLPDASNGTYEYTFLITNNGTTEEISDPKNTVNGKSVVEFFKPDVTIATAVNPSSISHNENAVLTIQASSAQPVVFKDGYMDLSALGGPSQVHFDTKLMAQTISVKDSITAGTKNIPITLVDEFGNRHTHTGTVNVKARTYAGSLDFDWDEARIYFALTDRFNDGDATNNENVDKTHLEAYHGGDFKGMIDKLDYLKELGINTLWITPIVDNIDFNKGVDFGSKQYGYHGYWAKDFTQLDEHLGDMTTFKALIDKAHDKGIKIMVDVVLNHTGYGLKPEDNRPGITQADKDRFAGMLRTGNVSSDPVVGELAMLPDFKTEDPAVRAKIIEWQAGWLNRARTTRGDSIDYFRVDTVKHVESTTWKAFKNALTQIDPNFKMIGEYFGATIDSDGGALHSGQMDSLLDFGFKGRARDFANGSIDSVDAYLADRETKLDNTTTMGQFLSSHDEDGFLNYYVGGDKGKLKISAALQITAKGQPIIYYGEELGQSGKNAADMGQGQFSENRKDMPWDQLTAEKALHDHYQKLLNIRAKYSKIYSKGTRTKLAGSDALGYLAFNKHYGSDDIVTIINTATAGTTATIPVPFAAGSRVLDEYSGLVYKVTADQKVTISMPGRDDGGTVILSKQPAINPPPSTPTNPPSDNDKQVVNEESLKNGKDGKVLVEIAAGNKAVLLPINAAAALGKNDLEIKSGNMNITLPNEVLEGMQKLLSGNDLAGSSISFEARPLPATEANKLIAERGTKANVKSLSEVYDFNLNVVKKDGSTIAVTTFNEPIVLKLKVTAKANKDLLGVYYLGSNGELQYVGGTLEGDVMTVTLTHFSTYAVLEYDKSFDDVKASFWGTAAIKALAAKQIVSGISDTRFAPERNVTRAEFAILLVRALGIKAEGQTKFKDVMATEAYSAYIATANRLGIVNGRSETIFAPNATITREEMAVMIIKALEVKAGKAISANNYSSAFADANSVSNWAAPFVNAASELGLVKGRANGKFAPKGVMTRAESAQVVYMLLSR
jgi:pullulanase